MGERPSPPPCGWSRGFIAEPYGGTAPEMTRTPGLTDTAVLVIQVAHLSDGCHTEDVYTALFTGRQTYQRIVALFSHQLVARARAPHHLTTTPFFQLNVMNGGTGRDILEG